MVKVLVCDAISERGVELLRQAGFEVTSRPKISPGELLQEAGKYDCLIVRGRTKVTRQVITQGTTLKAIGRAGVGLDNVDVQAADERKIRVLNTPESATIAVAELVLGLMLSLARGIPRADAAVKRGEWPKAEFIGTELEGKALGIVGMGRIGVKVARLAKAFGMSILGYDVVPIKPEIIDELGAQMVDLKTLLARSDYVSLHVPATPETYHLLNYEALKSMKRNAYLINASRGSVVNEADLARAIREGLLQGAGLDVFEEEPPLNRELIQLPPVVCTPHVGGQTREAQEAAGIMLAEKIIAAFSSSG